MQRVAAGLIERRGRDRTLVQIEAGVSLHVVRREMPCR